MEQYTILIVEDDISMSRVLEAQLKTGGYKIIKAYNGEEGLQMAKQHMPALILSDIMMPLMDGYELCRNIKKDSIAWQIPVILLSAKSDRASIIHGYSVGAAKYLTKPMKREELFKAIDLRLKYATKARQMLSRKAKEIEGDLRIIDIFKLLDMFSIGCWSGYIELCNRVEQHGTLFIENGIIDKCSLEGQFSPYNLFLILSWDMGTFKAHRH
jgi:CheY-like chemotaxis protein